MYVEVTEKIDRFNDLRLDLRKSVQVYIVDKSQSLDARWEVFLGAENALPWKNYSDGYIEDTFEVTNYDFGLERYTTMSYNDLAERLEEGFWDYKEHGNDDEYFTWHKRADLYDTWRETVLEAGFGGFTYDW